MNVTITDRDLGWNKIKQELLALNKKIVKVGVTAEKGKVIPKGERKRKDVRIVEYAYWNEFGVYGKKNWSIPPRPFVGGWADNKREDVVKTEKELFMGVSGGTIDSETAFKALGEFGRSGILAYIRDSGNFVPNAPLTIKIKGSDKPLIDEGFLLNAIAYEVVSKNEQSGEDES